MAEIEDSQKRFLCYWGSGYYEKGRKTKPLSWFEEDIGYTKEYIEQVKKLKVGQTLDLTEMCAVHTVKRIK